MDQRLPSQDQLKRRALWAMLWLEQLIHYMPYVLRLPKAVRAYVDQRLDLLAGFAINFVITHAAPHCRPGCRQRNRFAVWRATCRHDVRAHVTYSVRATIGGQLRRELKAHGRGAKNLKARAETILHALRNLDRLVARFVRRMRQGLSRRLHLHTRAKYLPFDGRQAGGASAQIAFGVELRVAFDAAAPP